MNPQYKEYYLYLEKLRKSGTTNMFGASQYLQQEFQLTKQDANKVLYSWMKHYEEINVAYY